MSRYIDIDTVLREAYRQMKNHVTVDLLEELPTADAVEVVHGKWVECDDGWDGVYYECSACKEAFTLIDGTPTDNLYNFCPNCGAKMDERRAE